MTETTLTRPDLPRPRHYRIRLEGRRLVHTAWTEGGKPRETAKEFDVQQDAGQAFQRLRDKKMREGFCCVGDGAARGDVLLEFMVPMGLHGPTVDLSPDGRTLVAGTTPKHAQGGAEIYLVDIATGRRRLVLPERPEANHRPPSPGHAVLHTVLFDADGERIIYALDGETRLLDPTGGHQKPLAAYRTGFEPFRLRPSWNRDRTRLLVFDAEDRIRVLDRQGDPMFETRADIADEYWGGALSQSGRLLALSRSKGKWLPDSPMATEIEVWDLERGTIRVRIPVPFITCPVDKVGFDPSETLVLAKPWGSEGPGAFSIDTTELVWHFRHPSFPDRWDYCFDWDYSPDGTDLAVGRLLQTDVVDAATRVVDPAFANPWPDAGPGRPGQAKQVRISDDGTVLVSAGPSGRILVRKLRGRSTGNATSR
ncbi:WD40 repeat domain-containing protein [Actinomadura sp. B10D3]|uniref:WD40 repeat domain-containing protein n=1 Tax=Actinomadura sp. B10D3 TaxID=3153557 RepID=UPI00325CA1AF